MTQERMQQLEDEIFNTLNGISSVESGCKERAAAVKETCELLDRYVEIEKNQADFWDREDRREIEKKKIETTAELEREKNRMTKTRLILEIAKIVVPVVIPAIFYGYYQSKMLEFEETGTITSQTGRGMHLPKFWR